MPLRDIVTAILVAFIWGLSFIAIRLGVTDVPPLMFTALRFALAALPAVFFIAPPKAPVRTVIAYGLAIGVAQFGILFVAIHLGMPPGLASLVLQSQVFFTIFLAAVIGERPLPAQIVGALIAFAGIGLIASERFSSAAFGPFVLTLVAAFAWAVGNIIGKRAGKVDMLAFTVWSSLAAPLPLVALSLMFEGASGFTAVAHIGMIGILSALFLAYGGTLFGFGAWARLLSQHPAAVVTPFALLVPVAGMASARIIFGEPISIVELMGAGLVFAGLAFNIFAGRIGGLARRHP